MHELTKSSPACVATRWSRWRRGLLFLLYCVSLGRTFAIRSNTSSHLPRIEHRHAGFGHGVQCTADVSCWATRLLLADTNDHTLSGTLPKNTGLPKNQVLDGQNVLANLATGRRSAINILCGNDCLFSFA